jgi:hypothetical protein
MRIQSIDTDDCAAGVYFQDVEKTSLVITDYNGDEIGPLDLDAACDLARAILAICADARTTARTGGANE